jgi:hypothetical protein
MGCIRIIFKKKLNIKTLHIINVMNDNRQVYTTVQSNYFSYEGPNFIAQYSHGILSYVIK